MRKTKLKKPEYVFHIEDAQMANKEWNIKKKAQSTVPLTAIFGVTAVFVAIMVGFKWYNIVLFVLGISMLAIAIWNHQSPDHTSFQAVGIILIIMGLWNAFTSFQHILHAIIILPLGAFQVIYGINLFQEAHRDKDVLKEVIPYSVKKEMNRIINEIQKTDPKRNKEFIEFSTTYMHIKNYKWKARLIDDAIYLHGDPDELRYCFSKKEFNIFKIGGKGEESMFQIETSIDYKTHKGMMQGKYFKRFCKWKYDGKIPYAEIQDIDDALRDF